MKKLLIAFAVLCLLCGCGAKTPSDDKKEPAGSAQPRNTKVSVEVTGYQGEKLLDKSIEYKKDMTALSALEAATEGKCKISGGGAYVTEIMGLKEKEHGASSGWMYGVNGESPSVGADKCLLKSGDKVEWTYFSE